MSKMRKLLIGMIVGYWLIICQTAWSAPQDDERSRFLQAEAALQRGDQHTFRKLKASLRNYPLAVYLDYAALKRNLRDESADSIRAFLDRHQGSPLERKLRIAWLAQLAANDQWRDYLAFHDPQLGTTFQCHRLSALLNTDKRAQAFQETPAVWRHGKSQPSACDPVFDAWRNAGKLTGKLVWERIALAMDKGQVSLAKYLGRYLGKQDQNRLDRWLEVHDKPEMALQQKDFAKDWTLRNAMLAYAVRRQTRKDANRALEMWGKLSKRYEFTADQRYDIERRLALSLVRETGVNSYTFVRDVKPRAEDKRLHEARLQAALMRQDWPVLKTMLKQLPPEILAADSWQYWLARALAETDKTVEAAELFKTVAGSRSYYGFLAADKVSADYHLAHTDTPVSPDIVAQFAELPGVLRARELRALGRWVDARREWIYATNKLSKEQLMAAAVLAESWGWHDQAIFTLAKTGYWEDLELRFPIRHRTNVLGNAARHELDPAWVFAVVRQESAFMEDAHSVAGARGLMQLMPATARFVARKVLDTKPPKLRDLYEPETNIGLGTAYLRRVMDTLGNHPVLATAAYNAGPHRVTRWLPETELPADIWVELVPFRETRGYLRRVLAYTVIYEKRLGLPLTRLSERMRPVSDTTKLTAGKRLKAERET